MALLHQAVLNPTKLELLAAWLPSRPWYQGSGEPRRVAACRFDDPAGEVGIETFLVRVGDGPILQAPLTYRAAPLDGAERWLVGTTHHSVLGPRWVYDACGDPVYADMLARTILTGAGQAEEFLDVDGQLVRRDPFMLVHGSGTAGTDVTPITTLAAVDDADPARIRTGAVELAVLRVVGESTGRPDGPTLTGTWKGQGAPVLLAYLRTT
jgi:hypothetical protein